jgi:hypothetical protein
LISTSRLESILGVEHVQILRDIVGHSSAKNTDGVVHSVCNGVAWSGTKPGSRTAGFQALVGGRAAAFTIATWEPDDQSPSAGKWSATRFAQLVETGVLASQVLPGLGSFAKFNGRSFQPRSFKLAAAGVIAAPLPGVRAGAAFWSNSKEHEIVSVGIGVSARASSATVAAKLNSLGGILVPNFGMTG